MRSEAELLALSGYGGRRQDFEDLLHILDGDVRLITPTDPEWVRASGAEGPRSRENQPSFLVQHGNSYSRPATEHSLLSTHPRLPRALAARLAEPKATGDAAGACLRLRLADRTALWSGASRRTASCLPGGSG